MQQFNGAKTYIVGLVTIAYAVVGMYKNTISVDAGSQLIVTGLAAMAVRHGISTTAATTTDIIAGRHAGPGAAVTTTVPAPTIIRGPAPAPVAAAPVVIHPPAT